MLKKTLSFVLSFALLAAAVLTIPVNAAEDESEPVSKVFYQVMTENNLPIFEDEFGNEIDINTLNDDVSVDEKSLPKSYDLRDYNRATPVRDQSTEGLCWDFASVSSIESNILSQPELASDYSGEKINNLDISEGGLSWYIHTNLNDPSSPLNNDYINDPMKGRNGGFTNFIAQSLISGFGTYPETLLPYSDVAVGYPSTMRFHSDYRLKDFNNLSDDTELIKDRILENGAVAVVYSCFNSNYKYSDDYTSYYDNGFNAIDPDDHSNLGHVVSIIGWDDSFSRENFLEECQPQNDGAWLCKNSWGDNWGTNGYFWMSYETTNMSFSQFIMQSADEFDNIYQNQFTTDANYRADIASNVFTANSEEYLTQISVSTGSSMDYTASVYRLSDNYSSPVEGQLLTEFEGSTSFNGVHTIELPDPVQLNKGDNFSVVITNHDPEESSFSVQTKTYLDRTYQKGKCYYYDNTDEVDGWLDCADESSDYGYVDIKAFTQNPMRKANTTELENAINTAENLVINNAIDENSVNKLNSSLENAKAVLNKTDSLQYEVNNACYSLNTSIHEIDNYFYYINNEEDFINYYNQTNSENISEVPKNVVFNNDLDFSGYDMEFEPLFKSIGFNGTVEGNNHVIKNIKIKDLSESTGLFKVIKNGSISNLTIDGALVNGKNGCGCFAGELVNGKIYNCHVIDSKVCADTRVSSAGGIAGTVSESIIENCSVENSEIVSLGSAGGITGDTSNSKNIINTTVSGNTVSGLDFVGYTIGGTSFDDSFVIYSVSKSIYFKPNITITDDECRVTSFLGTITSITSDDTDIVKLDDKYTFPLQNKMVNLKIDYEEEDPVDIIFDYNLNGEVIINDYYGTSKEVILPETIGGLPVTELDKDFSFFYQDEITSFVIPDNVTKVYDNLFKNLPNLKKVVCGNGLTVIPEYMFAFCPNIKQIELGDNVSVIEKGAFMGCGIEEITLPESVIEIQQDSFSVCNNLKKITLPDNLTKIEDSTFGSCIHLNEVVFGNNLKVIGDSAFYGCISLTNLEIPDSVEIIGEDAFVNSPLSKIVLGKNIKEIGKNAFGVTSYPNENYTYVKIPGYVINGYSSTAAEQYAEENGFKFVDLYVDEPDISDNIFDYSVFKIGDVNLDGIVSISDVTLIQKYLAGLTELNDIQKSNSLVFTYKKEISIVNATYIQRYLAELEYSLYDDSKG